MEGGAATKYQVRGRGQRNSEARTWRGWCIREGEGLIIQTATGQSREAGLKGVAYMQPRAGHSKGRVLGGGASQDSRLP
jgi:hypothetical protein